MTTQLHKGAKWQFWIIICWASNVIWFENSIFNCLIMALTIIFFRDGTKSTHLIQEILSSVWMFFTTIWRLIIEFPGKICDIFLEKLCTEVILQVFFFVRWERKCRYSQPKPLKSLITKQNRGTLRSQK